MGLILDLLSLRPQRGLVSIPVVATEEQVNSRRQDYPYVRLRITAITPVARAQGWCCQRAGHVQAPFGPHSLPLLGTDQAATPGWFTKGERLTPVIVRQCPQPPNQPGRPVPQPALQQRLEVGRKVLG